MELLGFFYEKSDVKIHANGRPITQELINQGFTQKNNSKGIPRWYVKPNKVWIVIEIDGVRKKFNIYNNILAIYPERKRMTLKLAQDVIASIIAGNIELILVNDKPRLIRRDLGKGKNKRK